MKTCTLITFSLILTSMSAQETTPAALRKILVHITQGPENSLYILTNMKNHFYLLALTLLLATFGQRASAQTYTGNLTLTTQAQVDAFNYTEVTGNLTIAGNPSDDIC